LGFCCAHVKAKFKDDLLIGTEHKCKIMPGCSTPNQSNIKTMVSYISQEENIKVVLDDPKFGMFSLFKYHLKHGYKNDILKKKNSFYCSHTFSLLAFLPIIVFFIQWAVYVALVANEVKSHKNGWCPNISSWDKKLIIFAVALLYFVRSFFLWDNLTDRTRLNRMLPSIDVWVMLDTFQEFGFNLFVYMANLWIVFSNDSLQEMIMNSLAMEFLMNLDNEFEAMYFAYLPEVAEDIYDNLFVTFDENEKKLEKRNKNCGFRCVRWTCFVPFKILVLALLLFPVFCLAMSIYGVICK